MNRNITEARVTEMLGKLAAEMRPFGIVPLVCVATVKEGERVRACISTAAPIDDMELLTLLIEIQSAILDRRVGK